jgi:pimeloyl-[acyl-carrier protein] synthase
MVNLKELNNIEFNELFENLKKDPYPFYELLLNSKEPLIAKNNIQSQKDIWLLSRYDHVLKFLSNNKDISCSPDYLEPEICKNYWDLFLLNLDGNDHIELRKILSGFFSKERLQLIELYISSFVPSLIRSIEQHNEINLISQVAEKLPLAVMGQIMGISDISEIDLIRQWTMDINVLGDIFKNKNGFSSITLNSKSMQLMAEFSLNLINEKKRNPKDDLTTYIIFECKGKNISEEKMIANVMFMLVATHDTTVNMLGNGMLLLLKNREQLLKLAKLPSMSICATEEILRFESPKQRATYRATKNKIKIDDFEIPSDTQVMVLLGAANRDPFIFDNPNVFDISRQNNHHLAFGHGIHNCLGKAIARLEGKVLFSVIAPYLLSVNMKHSEAIWRENTLFRIQESLFVTKD